ncbi:MAG: GGDEF domain-containing protein [Candidatus Omnitrophica bacterium]|nr:GGDEF domain-containing protein [Candidatus Omnitrophota bacterium]
MLRIIILVLLTVLLFIRAKKIVAKKLMMEQENCIRINNEVQLCEEESERLKKDNQELERLVEETIALYDITQDIYMTLDEEKMVGIFRERLSSYLRFETCIFTRDEPEASRYPNATVLPLSINKTNAGYLVVVGVKEEDRDKMNILAHQLIISLKKAILYKKVQELAITDTLTQVFSRRHFLERFNEELERSIKFKLHFSFLMVDVDHFKEINDNYGHLVGDAVLREIAKGIKDNIRQIDFIGRWGGEEFAIIFVETEKNQAVLAAERIRKNIESNEINVYDERLKGTISVGIATFPDDAADSALLIEKADKALYIAKEQGRNRVVCV